MSRARPAERVALALGLAGAAACGGGSSNANLEIWAHAGQAAERRVVEAQVDEFRSRHPLRTIDLVLIPEGSYNGQVQAASAAGDLPDVLELDGPYVARSAWQGVLRPLDELLPADVVDDLLPSIVAQGSYDGQLFAVGTFDSGLALFARRSRLAEVGARLPSGPATAWTAAEMQDILGDLARTDPDGAVLDLKLNYGDEWLTYGFSPVLVSAGADLVDRGRLEAGGTLDSPAAVAAMTRLQRWIGGGLVDPNLDDAAFTSGRVAVSWVGHWEYSRYRDAAGDDLVLLPLPDFGVGSRTDQGSWCWTITRRSDRPGLAAAFLELLLEPEEVRRMTDANDAVPATRTAISASPAFAPGGPRHLYVVQLQGPWAVPRPRTPAYPTITAAFARAFRAVRDGADVATTLRSAARTIDHDIASADGYPPPSRRTGGEG